MLLHLKIAGCRTLRCVPLINKNMPPHESAEMEPYAEDRVIRKELFFSIVISRSFCRGPLQLFFLQFFYDFQSGQRRASQTKDKSQKPVVSPKKQIKNKPRVKCNYKMKINKKRGCKKRAIVAHESNTMNS